MFDKVSIIGLGYIGLPTAAVISRAGINTYGYDNNLDIVDTVNLGRSHIVEPGLSELIEHVVSEDLLRANSILQPADVYIICVPTPVKKLKNDVFADLEHVFAAIYDIAKVLKEGDLILIESTCPVGTTEKISSILYSEGLEKGSFYLAYCPERIIPGRALIELVENDRVVGGIDKQSSRKATAFYESYVKGEVHMTNAATAELCKLAENSFRDVNIAFANELSIICEKNDINAWELIKLANKHPRVNILNPGTGVGGHCISVDPWFIVAQNPTESKLITTARHVNDYKPDWVAKKIIDTLIKRSLDVSKSKVALFGLAFKPDIDDMRESPAVIVFNKLREADVDVMVVEPNIQKIDEMNFVNIETAVSEADLIAVLVRHSEFLSFDIQSTLRRDNVLDFCGIFED
jgi:UDP-N-acetyl-D-mannosaminuronic acid dehydrogenase